MVTLFGGLSRKGHNGKRSSTPNPHNGTTSLVSDTITMGTTWVTIVNQFQAQVPPGQANIVTNALSMSRPHRTENQEIDHSTQRGANKDLARIMTFQASNFQLSMEEMKRFEEAH